MGLFFSRTNYRQALHEWGLLHVHITCSVMFEVWLRQSSAHRHRAVSTLGFCVWRLCEHEHPPFQAVLLRHSIYVEKRTHLNVQVNASITAGAVQPPPP